MFRVVLNKSLDYHSIVNPAITATVVVATTALALMHIPADAGVGAGVAGTSVPGETGAEVNGMTGELVG